jgi:transcriptional regulator with XRE-family HTH domain
MDTIHTQTDFARRLADLIAADGRSVSKIAAAAGLDQSLLSRYLSGTRHPKPAAVIALSETLGVQPHELSELTATVMSRGPQVQRDDGLGQLERELLRALRTGGARAAIGFLQRHAA